MVKCPQGRKATDLPVVAIIEKFGRRTDSHQRGDYTHTDDKIVRLAARSSCKKNLSGGGSRKVLSVRANKIFIKGG